ncbi:MAG: DUF3747 domain-containing protein [Cyanobacteria bacterium J06627_15]
MHALRKLTTFAAVAATAWLSPTAAAFAQQFDARPIPSNRVVAVAEPVRDGQLYNLLIIQQISDVRRCYEERGDNPTTVDPLLRNFDFSGLCSRSSDSNGYSVRLAGEDTRYRLQVVRRDGYLALVASPSPLQRNLPTIEIGRSDGIANDFVKIELNAGWQMSSRIYNGQTLGHIYLESDRSLDQVIADAGGASPSPSPRPSPSPSPSPVPRPSLPSPPSTGQPLPSPGGGSDSNVSYRVVVPGSSELLRRRVVAVAPGSFRTTVNGQSVIQAGRFNERNRAEELQRELSRADLTAQIVQTQGRVTPAPPSSGGDVFYQVIVPGSSDILRSRVNAVEPGAFRTNVNGRAVIQAGLFRESARADDLRRRLAAADLPVEVIQGRGAITTPSPSPTPTPTPLPPRQGRILVMIDPGHGGRDPGAIGIGGLREKDINITISRRVQDQLEAAGIQVVMTRTNDSAVSLQGRVDLAERANATVFVSIHANAISLSRPEVNGLETYYYSSGLTLARTIHNRILQNVSMADRGVRRARFYVLRNTSMPAVLVETGFVTGRDDAARFRNPAAVQEIADSIAQGIIDYVR